MRRPPLDFDLQDFDLLIIDETHHLASKSFQKIVFAASPTYVVGCTATTQRTDKLDSVVELLIGPCCFTLKSKVQADVQILKYHHQDFKIHRQYNGDVDFVKNMTQLCKHQDRTRTIAKYILKILKDRPEAYFICLGQRQQVCIDLFNLLDRHGTSAGIMTQTKTTPNAIDQKVLIATSQMCGEGFNDKRRNVLVLLTPYKGPQIVSKQESRTRRRGGSQLIQILYRCLRRQTTSQIPLIVDVVDTNTIFERMLGSRIRLYQDKQFTILNPIVTRKKKKLEVTSSY
jgi:hypothetical protein